MTSIDLQTSSASTNETGIDSERRKSVLFCPVCGHESPVDGNWHVTTDHGHREFTCPECGQVVATR